MTVNVTLKTTVRMLLMPLMVVRVFVVMQVETVWSARQTQIVQRVQHQDIVVLDRKTATMMDKAMPALLIV